MPAGPPTPGAPPPPTDPPPQGGRWYDTEAGPLVRPYALTGAPAEPPAEPSVGPTAGPDLVALVAAVTEPPSDRAGERLLGPRHRTLLALCRAGTRSVADLAAGAGLPVGAVRVLLGDLSGAGLVTLHRPAPVVRPPDEHTLREVIDGLRAL
ncbi:MULTISPECIES: DUF742 domain-containing protein [Streptomyces]|uniref:DUF742 domain-containing protein n=2 Tax=Streptomyces TaxID=1883 RepID=A0A100Y9U6_9ACTN|nr:MULTISPECIES: DUF742 domain-containing protein [Streptomyces]KUH40302.1 hypothetical protein ATE80_03165 [Streptomyces kanasensis]UUS35026.1 DUF742 domain-containing protein [Streptomyces changanensis]